MIDKLLEKVLEQGTKFILVSGGVCSSIGKGVLTSSIAALLKHTGASVSVMKWDPYLNVDPGTMSPLEHGEVFVTDDGTETDLDLGHYERVLGIHLRADSSVSSGQIFKDVLDGEREGKYLGKCIQLVPHVVEAIKERALRFALNSKAEYVLIEIGGTVGDMEGEIFLEAIRQLHTDLGHDMFYCHLSYVPYLEWANEIKTKPTQHSVMLLKKAGLVPDALFLRLEKPINEKTLTKVALMCGVPQEHIFSVQTRTPTFRLFLDLKEQGLHYKIQDWFGVKKQKDSDLRQWGELIARIEKKKKHVTIALVAKYVGSSEPYISVVEAIKSAAYASELEPIIELISAEALAQDSIDAWATLKRADGIVVPGGFGERGVAGKIAAAKWAREHQIPYLGLCLGMQVMLIEAARNVLGMDGAGSTEFGNAVAEPIISLLAEQEGVTEKGATMRLGAFDCHLVPRTKAAQAYGKKVVRERHRHRYEFNNKYKQQLEQAGVVFSGFNKELDLVEIAEYRDHPFMVGVQFHPEFLSTPLQPHPLFVAFMKVIKI